MKLEPGDIDDLQPVIASVVDRVLERLAADSERLGDRLAYSELEAADLLGLPRHVLRDMRLRGQISAKKCGKQFRYSRQTLVDFLNDK